MCKSGEMRKVTLLGTRTGIYWYPPFLGIHRMIPATAECRESWMEEAGLDFGVFGLSLFRSPPDTYAYLRCPLASAPSRKLELEQF